MERYSDFKEKEVINLCDGNKLGYVTDLEIDLRNGRICKIVVSGQGKIWDIFCCPKETVLDWGDIKRIGDDTILVDPNGKKRILYDIKEIG